MTLKVNNNNVSRNIFIMASTFNIKTENGFDYFSSLFEQKTT